MSRISAPATEGGLSRGASARSATRSGRWVDLPGRGAPRSAASSLTGEAHLCRAWPRPKWAPEDTPRARAPGGEAPAAPYRQRTSPVAGEWPRATGGSGRSSPMDPLRGKDTAIQRRPARADPTCPTCTRWRHPPSVPASCPGTSGSPGARLCPPARPRPPFRRRLPSRSEPGRESGPDSGSMTGT
jgi:hypothetical protein